MKRTFLGNKTLRFAILAFALVGLFAASPAVFAGQSSAFAHPQSQARSATQSHKVYFPSRAAWAQIKRSHAVNGVTQAVQGSGDLAWKGGPVQKSPVTYAIFWGSSWTGSSVATIIKNYFTDVGTTSFENILTQYSDSGGHINNTHNFAASWVDTANPPTDTSCGGSATVQDSSITSEVSHAISVNGWPTNGTNAVYYVYTPSGDAINDGTGACSAPAGNFCAYHNWTGTLAYGAMPYPGSGCTVSTSPNGNISGDSEVNLTSHEQFEAITDPQAGNGWLDASGYEIGDKCAWDFSFGTTTLNNGRSYEVQTEYSNASHSCVNSYGSTGGSAPVVSSFSPTSGAAGTSVTITGSNFTGATAVKFNGTSASFTVNSSTQITATVPSGATSGPISVTNSSGTGTSSSTFTVSSGGGGNSAQLITNGGFEAGQSPWSESSTGGYQIVDPTNPHSGAYSAYLCGYNNCVDKIWQTVTIPSTMTKATETFWLYINTNESGSTCYDYFYARIRTTSGAVITTPLTQCNANAHGWTQYSYDVTSALSAYKGQQVQIYFAGTTDSSLITNFFVDDVAFNVNY